MTEKQKAKDFLKKEGVVPKKHLGQNFLINQFLAQKIVGAVKKLPPPYIEIGPGLGVLTRHFNKKDLFLIEKDKKLSSYWTKKGFVTYCTDALKADFNQFSYPSILFGNLPYSLAGPLIIKSSICKKISTMIFMIQKEVASRVKGKVGTKNYGILSVASRVFWEVSAAGEAKPEDFYPVPKVSGKILTFTRNLKIPQRISKEPELFIKFLKLSFSNRRKKLIKQFSNPSNQKINLFLQKSGKSSNIRAEELSPKEFMDLYLFLFNA